MQTLVKSLRHHFSQTAIPLSLAYPFDYTFKPEQFAFIDIRFTEVPFSKELWPPEQEHVHLVLKRFQHLLTGGLRKDELDSYISKGLKAKAQ